ncbi:helix-turn-helix domain-containing protein [Salibacterium salarium]|uniref:helix-turn-helix domain-containing protein n=1 Tax=Salibacterium salarium TaxID=284579 RepID=UPI00163A2560|nr:helix-turn-helix domain-containing protein [Salibacterium salarium]
MNNLMELALKARNNDSEAMSDILEQFEPFIQKSLKQTSMQEREDLQQDLRLACFESIHHFHIERVPGFFEFCEKQTGLSQKL